MPEHELTEAIPTWLTAKYFEDFLKKYEKDENLKVISTKFTDVTGKGEHYASVMWRAALEVKSSKSPVPQKRSYVVKSVYEDPEKNSMFAMYGIYKREIEMYEKISVEIAKVLKSIGDNTQLFPEALHHDYEREVLVFEDLSLRGFRNVDRRLRLDLHQAKMVMEKLAKMHAATAKMEEKNPGMFAHYNQSIFNRSATAFVEFFLMHLEIFIEELATWEDYKQYAPKLRNLLKDFNERASQVFDPSKDFMNVLIHGDLWTNNIMFTFDDKNRATDLLFVDLQFSSWTSPVVDILYFAHNSLKEDLRQENIPELIQYYHTHLCTLLKKLDYKKKVPTLREMHVMLLEKGFMAFLAGVVMQPIMLVEDSTNADMDTLISESDAAKQFKRNLYRNPKTKTAVKYLLPFLDQRGLLD
uniref:Putative ecdysteroid kinase n=1 Tax=Nyssomyia neivai TaxID=330878 RepID=A0A1L8DZA2_9DIPT